MGKILSVIVFDNSDDYEEYRFRILEEAVTTT